MGSIKNMYPDKTIAALNYVLKDAKKYVCIGEIVLQIVLMIFYAYSIVANLSHLILLCINAVMLAVTLAYFIFYLCTLKKTRQASVRAMRRTTKQVVTYVKWAIRLATIGVSIYELIAIEISKLKLAVTILTIVCLVLQIILTCIFAVLSKYVAYLSTAFRMDMKDVTKVTKPLTNISASIVNAVNKPFGAMAGDKAVRPPEEPDPDEQLTAREREIKKHVLALAEEENAAREQEKQAALADAKLTLKENFKAIFRRKKK